MSFYLPANFPSSIRLKAYSYKLYFKIILGISFDQQANIINKIYIKNKYGLWIIYKSIIIVGATGGAGDFCGVSCLRGTLKIR